MSKLLIEEPPLQVLPSLALVIGLNEAIVLQQLHYLLRDPRFGKRIAEHQWIFNTVEQWVCTYFPFWSVRTMKNVFASLAAKNLIVTCQPEGGLSRRKYYRINVEELEKLSHRAKVAPSIVQNVSLPITKTTKQRLLSKESKETPSVEGARKIEEFEPKWTPIDGTKDEQLKRIRPPKRFPSEREFDAFIESRQLDQIGMGKRGDLYRDLCLRKWQHWDGRRWRKVNNWREYVAALDRKMEEACGV